jgi:hypothetical protein
MPQRGELQVEDVLHPSDHPVERLPVWPMIAGVVASAFILDFICGWLPRGSASRFGVVVLAVSLLFVAVMVSGSVVRAIYTRMHVRRVATPVIRAACITALWVPAWVLFVETWSLLMIAAGVVCLACLGVFLKQCDIESAAAKVVGPVRAPGTPFQFEAKPLAHVLLPSLALAVLFNATIALAAMHWFVTASIAAGIFAGILGWRAVLRSSPVAGTREVLSSTRQMALATTAFLFTVIALFPFLRVRPLTPGFPGLFAHKTVPKNTAASTNQATASDGYPGIILVPLTEQQKKIIAPVKREFVPHFGVKIAEPLEIPFDGQYWYFKWPDKRPRPSAHVVRASAAKVQIRSSDRDALLMEAHQKLGQQLDLGCCSAMNLVVENADQLEGAISLELWVKKQPFAKTVPKPGVKADPEPPPHYLGTVVIPSSQLPIAARPNASGKIEEETLRFPIPAAMDGIQFDEITVVVRPAPIRAKMGAKIAIKKFVMEP